MVPPGHPGVAFVVALEVKLGGVRLSSFLLLGSIAPALWYSIKSTVHSLINAIPGPRIQLIPWTRFLRLKLITDPG